MKIIGIIVNLFLPGIGTLVAGKPMTGVIQFILFLISVLLIFTGIFAIIGLPLVLIVLIWSIVSVASMPTEPVQVVVVERGQGQR